MADNKSKKERKLLDLEDGSGILGVEASAAQLIADLSQKAGSLKVVGGGVTNEDLPRMGLVPSGFDLVDLEAIVERYAARPLQVVESVKLTTIGGFTNYIAQFRNAGTAIFADRESRMVTAVLDYHEISEDEQYLDAARSNEKIKTKSCRPGWGRWRAEYQVEHSGEWSKWREARGLVLDAEHVLASIMVVLNCVYREERLREALDVAALENDHGDTPLPLRAEVETNGEFCSREGLIELFKKIKKDGIQEAGKVYLMLGSIAPYAGGPKETLILTLTIGQGEARIGIFDEKAVEARAFSNTIDHISDYAGSVVYRGVAPPSRAK